MHFYNLQIDDDSEICKGNMLKTFGGNIRELRINRNLTQEVLSEKAGLNPKYLGEIERGEKNPTALVVYKLSRALDVSVSAILSDGNNTHENNKYIKEIEKLFEGKRKKDIQKAIKVLEILFD